MHPLFKMLAMNVDKKLHKSNFLVCNTKPLSTDVLPQMFVFGQMNIIFTFVSSSELKRSSPTNFTWMPTRLNEIRV